MSRLRFVSVDSDSLNRPPEPPKQEPQRTVNCPRCGRFCRHVESHLAYDGSGTQLYMTVNCSRCGEFTEFMW